MSTHSKTFLHGCVILLLRYVSATSVEEGRGLCEAAKTHVAILAPQVQEQQRKAGLTDADVAARFANLKAEYPVFKAFTDQDEPTKVVKMNMPDTLRESILKEVYTVRNVEMELRRFLNSTVTGYNPFKLEFEMAAIFVPSCVEFMELNRDIVQKTFPHMHTCQCNAFVVPAGTNAYGFHHASNAGYEFGMLYHNGVLVPEWHMSFHTAVTSSNLSSNPFTIFDGARPEVFNTHFLVHHFREKEGSVPADTMKVLKAACLMYEEFISPMHMRVIQDYLHAMYYLDTQCAETTGKPGNYWTLEPGEALYFNNWRVHGDSGLGSSEHDRVTMDLRCYSDAKIPASFDDSWDWARRMSPHLVNGYEKAAECLLRLFNYSQPSDFLETAYGRKMPNGVVYYSGLGNLGLNDAGDVALLHKDTLPGMRKHTARVRKAYDDGTVNFDAFMSCYKEHEVAFGENFRDAPLPWSPADRVWTYPKLYLAFAPAWFHGVVVLVLASICLCVRLCIAPKAKTA